MWAWVAHRIHLHSKMVIPTFLADYEQSFIHEWDQKCELHLEFWTVFWLYQFSLTRHRLDVSSSTITACARLSSMSLVFPHSWKRNNVRHKRLNPMKGDQVFGAANYDDNLMLYCVKTPLLQIPFHPWWLCIENELVSEIPLLRRTFC